MGISLVESRMGQRLINHDIPEISKNIELLAREMAKSNELKEKELELKEKELYLKMLEAKKHSGSLSAREFVESEFVESEMTRFQEKYK